MMKNEKELVTVSKEQNAYLEKQQRNRREIQFFRVFILLVFLIIWELCSYYEFIDSFFFSSPLRIIKSMIFQFKEAVLLRHIAFTLAETLISFCLVNLLSLGLAILLWYFYRFAAVSEPYLIVLNSLPKSALAPLLIVWLGTGMTTIIVAGLSVALFGSVITLYQGFLQTDKGKLKLIYTLGGTKKDALFKLILPGNLPLIISNMKVNIGLALVGVIIGEFLAAKEGLGYLIIYSSQVFKLDILIMSIAILCMIAMVLYLLLSILEKKRSW